MRQLNGSIARRLQTLPHFQAIIGIKVAVVNQWFETRWWETTRTEDGDPIWRAYTTDHCISFVEIPPEPYASAQHVIRSVYSDRAHFVEEWSRLAKESPTQLKEKLHEGLVHLFANNGITTPADIVIPPPTATVYHEENEVRRMVLA